MNTTTQTNRSFPLRDLEATKKKVLSWLRKFSTFSFLDNHHYSLSHHSFECLVAAGCKQFIKANAGIALEELERFIKKKPGCWLFGHLGYDLKNETEDLTSRHPDHIGFPDLFFFEPEWVLQISPGLIMIEGEEPEKIFSEIESIHVMDPPDTSKPGIRNRISKQDYISIIHRLQQHILRGDCYEINFCQEFYDKDIIIDPVQVFKRLSSISPNPFAALYKVYDQWLVCASPERFLKKEGRKIFSQPIKGTASRSELKGKDEVNRIRLAASQKERSENVMVVDLVRNDLSRVCERGSVQVDELFGIYSFPQVHQMISTVSGLLKEEVSFSEIIRACFPMGSMTGAPKKRVMELIEKYERTKRGIFSGAVGYISPSGDFDLNVVIRSIMYNQATGYLSFQAGSGITFYSDPEQEWEECLLKAEAIRTVLNRHF